MAEETFDGRIILNSDLKHGAAGMLEWASQMGRNYTAWPDGMPTPEGDPEASEEQNTWCERTNTNFVIATTLVEITQT